MFISYCLQNVIWSRKNTNIEFHSQAKKRGLHTDTQIALFKIDDVEILQFVFPAPPTINILSMLWDVVWQFYLMNTSKCQAWYVDGVYHFGLFETSATSLLQKLQND